MKKQHSFPKYLQKKLTIICLILGVIATPTAVLSEAVVTEQQGDTIVSPEEAQTSPKSILVASELTNNIDPSGAVTVKHITMPLDQLVLLVKPLTLSELEIEAAAWFLLLREKAQHIAETEISIKLENIATKEEKIANKLLEEAEADIIKAETKLSQMKPNSPAYHQALDELEAGKKLLYEGEDAVRLAIKSMDEFQADQKLQAELAQAKISEKMAIAREVLEKSLSARFNPNINTNDYQEVTKNSDILEKSFLKLSELQAELNDVVPQSEEYLTINNSIKKLEDLIIETAMAIANIEDLSLDAEKDHLSQSIDSIQILDDIEIELQAIEKIIRNTARDQSNIDTEELIDSIEKLRNQLERASLIQREFKSQLLANVVKLQAEEVQIVDRFKIILNELDNKQGDSSKYRSYMNDVISAEFDIRDVQALQVRIVGWLNSKEGGVRLRNQLAIFVGILILSVIIAYVLSKVVEHFLTKTTSVSYLLRDFLVIVVQRGGFVIGILVALTSLGVSLGPILALFGGVSFVLAFALQSNLGNFASGLMLLINKPFDVGDEIQIQGHVAFVETISLVNTKLRDTNGNLIILPNNAVWGGDIINYTHSENRRLVFRLFVPFTQDIDQLKTMWFELTEAHPDVLKDPAPSLSCPWTAQYDYSIRVDLKAWCATENYRPIYLNVLQRLQQRLQALDIKLANAAYSVRLATVIPAVNDRQV